MATAARMAGAQTAEPWPKLSAQQQAEAISQLKDFANQTQSTLKRPLNAFETKYFLFCSDLKPQEAQNWAGLLDRMYVKLAEMFAVPKGENIWRGKALIFVFSRADDYRRYEKEMMHTDPTGTAGMCHASSNGIVRIAFYRQKDALNFAHVLVHESVHGFLHRYRTPVNIPSWANEGLAETIATDLVPQSGRRNEVITQARENMRQHGGDLGEFFTTDHIEGWQYPVAETLCTFMIQNGKRNYVNFINGIKDGLSWRDSLDEKYQAPVERLVRVFGNQLGVRGLRAKY
ncbi:MAG TPA: hypothetical protein VN541_21730 [Tepidisphaeraceae bacterium]|nr:hypothetical protein [Tepidisphaeraceae bacterium]